jgi:glyoxylase-like metal-dependent hydrolase (beta-lactamase superfamily II)
MNVDIPISEHFDLVALTEGVYAAIGVPGGAAYSNAGIVDLGDSTLVFDTFDTHIAGSDLKEAAEILTGRPATYVINSHFHADHWLGNQAFSPSTPIIATHRTREIMPEWAEYITGLKADPSELQQALSDAESRLEAQEDPDLRVAAESNVARIRYELAALPDVQIRLPSWTFNHDLSFHGAQRRAELRSKGKGHTESDAYLILPDDDIMLMGDLGFFDCQPFFAYADPEPWKAQLIELQQSPIEVFVPGHGPVGDAEDLRLELEYIVALQEMVASVVENDGTVEDALQHPLPEQFRKWQKQGMMRFEANVWSIFKRLIAE